MALYTYYVGFVCFVLSICLAVQLILVWNTVLLSFPSAEITGACRNVQCVATKYFFVGKHASFVSGT